MRCIGFMLSWLLASVLTAADLPDPTTSWHPRHAIATLAALRGPLDAQPNDPALLTAAQMAYVELCFMGEPELFGAFGPWLERAREISQRRRKAHGEAAWTTLAEAAPDLWLAVLEGRTLEVVNGLASWPADAQSPHARALRALATRDPTVFAEHGPQTPLERYAYLMACAATTVMPGLLTPEQQVSGGDPFILLLILDRNEHWHDHGPGLREVIADVAWMFNSAEIADPIAHQSLQDLAQACGDTATLTGTRTERMRTVMQAARRCDPQSAQPVIAAWKACRAVSGSGSLMTSDGRHRLVGVPEVAAWNLDRLYLAVIHQMRRLSDRAGAPLGAAYGAALPGSLLAGRAGYPTYTTRPTTDQVETLTAAIKRGLAGEEGSSPAIASWALEHVAKNRRNQTTSLISSTYQQLHPAESPRSRVALHSIWTSAVAAGCTHLVARHIVAAAAADPFDQELFQAARSFLPERPLVTVETAQPALERTDSQLDVRSMPVPETTLKQFVSGRWQGYLRLDAGSTQIAIESDDGSRLFLGDEVLLNLGQHPMQVRSMTVDRAAAGWLPLRLEWYNAGGGGGIRLLWQPTGASAWQPIPADRLAHGSERQPGLAAQYWQHGKNLLDLVGAPQDVEIQRVSRMPWHYRAKGDLGIALVDAKRPGDALPYLREACSLASPSSDTRRALVRALAGIATPEVADELAEAFHTQSCFNGDVGRIGWIAVQMARAGSEQRIQELFANKHHGCCVEGLALGYLALCRADWQQALASFADLEANRKLDRPQERWYREHVQILKAMLQRVTTRQEPDWDAWREFSMDNSTTPYIRLFVKWYTGQISWEEATARRTTTVDGDAILWLHAVHCCTVGEHDQAQRDMQEMNTAHPTWLESGLSTGLLRWYGRQTPATLAAMPTAAPLPAQRGAPTPEEKPNF